MKYHKKLGLYKASNVTFNLVTREAYSYGWWRFVSVVNGYVVFNNYSYSVSTCKHQSKVRSLMNELGIKIDLIVECSGGLQRYNAGEEALTEAYIVQDFEKVKLIKKVFKVSYTQEQIQEIYTLTEERIANRFLMDSVMRQEKKEYKESDKQSVRNSIFNKELKRLINEVTE